MAFRLATSGLFSMRLARSGNMQLVALGLLETCGSGDESRRLAGSSTRRTPTMEWIRRVFWSEIRESHVGVALILCLLIMSAMSVALVWQAQIIANQRDAIRWLEQLKAGN